MRFGGQQRLLLNEREAACRCLTAEPLLFRKMRTSEFDSIADFADEALLSESKQRNWLWFGLVVSLMLHIALCTYFYRTRFQSTEGLGANTKETPMFKIKNVDLSPQLDKN